MSARDVRRYSNLAESLAVLGRGLPLLLCTLAATSLQAKEGGPVDQAALVQQLGHPVYAERRDAARRFESLGLRAFDTLRAAAEHPDPEIAESSKRLLAEVIGSWAWREDPPLARRVLEDFGDLGTDARVNAVAELAKLPLEQGVPALARIARFDASDRVARTAAIALLAAEDYRIDPRHESATIDSITRLRDRYGAGGRLAAQWLDLAADESALSEAYEAWTNFAADYADSIRHHSADADPDFLAVLHWRRLRVALASQDSAGVVETIEALQAVDTKKAGSRLSRAMQWIADARHEPLANEVATTFADRLEDKRGQYRMAELSAVFGHTDAAETYAASALAAEATSDGGRLETLYGAPTLIAGNLRRRGYDDWAIAEYRALIEKTEPEAEDRIEGARAIAQWRLADIYYDAAQYAEAAEVLADMTGAAMKSQSTRDQYEKLPQVQWGVLPRLGALSSHERLNAALAARDAGDKRSEMVALQRAIVKDPSNADVLIAMYRVKDPPKQFAAYTRKQIARMRLEFEKEIWDWSESSELEELQIGRAQTYNTWAWLVGNTEGDFDKAVRYSQRSLEILPDQAGCLDTLGRCLYSAGRVEEAVEAQRRAVELQPWVKIMRRQLEEFEAALADRTSSGEPAE